MLGKHASRRSWDSGTHAATGPRPRRRCECSHECPDHAHAHAGCLNDVAQCQCQIAELRYRPSRFLKWVKARAGQAANFNPHLPHHYFIDIEQQNWRGSLDLQEQARHGAYAHTACSAGGARGSGAAIAAGRATWRQQRIQWDHAGLRLCIRQQRG